MKILTDINPLIWPKVVLYELGKSLFFFPIRYYTFGLRDMAKLGRRQILWYERLLAVRLSWQTLFMPLYGDYTRSGRMISLGLRLFLLLFRLAAFLAVVAVIGVLFLLYGLLPVLIIYLVVRIN